MRSKLSLWLALVALFLIPSLAVAQDAPNLRLTIDLSKEFEVGRPERAMRGKGLHQAGPNKFKPFGRVDIRPKVGLQSAAEISIRA